MQMSWAWLSRQFDMDRERYNWQSYRSFFQFPIIRYMIYWFALVPAVLTVTSDLPGEICAAPYCINLSLPFSWWLLWLASLSFIAAYVLYQFFCPRFIKQYPSYAEFKSQGHSPRWAAWQIAELVENQFEIPKLVERLLTKGFVTPVTSPAAPLGTPIVEADQTVVFIENAGAFYRFGAPPREPSAQTVEDHGVAEADQEVFWEVFGRFAKAWPKIRCWVLSLLIASLIGVILVVVQNILSVILILCGHISTP